jgi:hypothetical protein
MLKDVPAAVDGPASPRPSSRLRYSTPLAPGDRFAAWALRGPLTVTLALLATVQLALWVPHYLKWPYWADHDVFATAARAWADGRLPYREIRLNNFPATIYLFYGLGTLFGWARPWTLFAFDSALLVGFGALASAWSRRTFGRVLPGLAGSFVFFSYYMALDYCHVAQRDWHAPAFMAASLMAAQMAPGRGGRIASALAAAVAVAFRPQVIFLMPAMLLALDENARKPGEPWSKTVRAAAEWGLVFALGVALAFAPLIVAGLMGDFLRSLRVVAYGGRYNAVTSGSILRGWLTQAAPWRWWAVVAAIVLLGQRSGSETRRTARTWLVALAGASLYKPLSPVSHSYLDIPPMLVWSINLGVLVEILVSVPRPAPALQLVGVLVALAMGPTSIRPEFCLAGPSARALGLLAPLPSTEDVPPGYRRGTVPTSSFYEWRDYRGVLDYLKAHTRPETKVANALKGDPAIVSMVDRPSVFPAEGTTWLRMVNPGDEPVFADALEACRDSVAVWDPEGKIGPDAKFKIERVAAVIRRHYEPEARFGDIEVWRRKAE